MSSQEDGDAAAQESDQEADSPAQSSGSADSRQTSDESGSGNESGRESEQLELEAEEVGLEVADVDLEAPRAKRRRAAVVGSHDEGCLAQPSDMPGQLTCLHSQLHFAHLIFWRVPACTCENVSGIERRPVWSAAQPSDNVWYMHKLDSSCMTTTMRVTVVTRHHSFDYICIVTPMRFFSKNSPLHLFCASCASSVLVQAAFLLLVQAVCFCATGSITDRMTTPVQKQHVGGAGPSNSEDISDIVTGKRRRQHIDYKVSVSAGTIVVVPYVL